MTWMHFVNELKISKSDIVKFLLWKHDFRMDQALLETLTILNNTLIPRFWKLCTCLFYIHELDVNHFAIDQMPHKAVEGKLLVVG